MHLVEDGPRDGRSLGERELVKGRGHGGFSLV